MFALAVSRATPRSSRALANDDEAPSLFLRLVPAAARPSPSAHPLSLRGLVGHLRTRRRVGVDRRPTRPRRPGPPRRGRASPGRRPDDWYGLLEPTTDDPLVDLDEPVDDP